MNRFGRHVIASCALLCSAACAEGDVGPEAAAKPAKQGMTAAERVARLGGYVIYPGSQKGQVVFIDAQDAVVVKSDFDEVFGHFRRQVPVKLDYAKRGVGADAAEPASLKADSKADFAVVFVNDDSSPATVVVPEEGYAVVNFAKYTGGLKLPDDAAKYSRRCVRAALKAFVLLCGGGSSRYPGHVATAHTPQELDFMQDKLPIDIQDSMKKYLSAAGVTPLRRTIYQRACQEGWAPAPTNDFQKAIWDKVHAMPTKPLKIKPEPRKVAQ